MTEKDLERLLAQKTDAPARKNVSLVLSPDITRNAMRLKKKRRDRIQTVLCVLAAAVFIALAAWLIYAVRISENPETILRPAAMAAGGAMGMTLLLSPALAWFSEEERGNEA